MVSDDERGKLFLKTYTLTWISAATVFTTPLINYFTKNVSFSFVFSLILYLLITKFSEPTVKTWLIWFSERSKRPFDKRLYDKFNGWTAFLMAILLVVIFSGVLKIYPPFKPGYNVYVPVMCGTGTFLMLSYFIFTKKI